ncbi:MAG: Alanine racemase [Firmicutes bacterium ADurb.Bin193]|nr:MAG: Alanine racemase [Firmicutes bacterium ADurb.Bin193]
MGENLYRTWCEVSLDAMIHNLNQLKGLAQGKKIMGVVKADAYGHGVCEVSRALADNGIDALAVAFTDEAIQLRKNGIDIPILILGHTPVEYMGELVDYNITPTVYNFSLAKAVSNVAQRRNKTAKIHVKIDTGMNRLGYPWGLETADIIMDLATLPNIEIEGLYTHFASADDPDESYTRLQFERFMKLADEIERRGLHIPIKHVCNSAAAMRFPEMHLDMIRVGISLYGLYPSDFPYGLELRPAMQLKSTIAHIKEVEAGERISYNGIYTTKRKTRLATIPIGYADGYSRLLSGKARVIVNGKFAPVLGTICMDQCMIDVTDVNNINIEDEVILFGAAQGLSIPIEELARIEGTINYELLCVVGKRIPRCFTQDGRVVEILNYLI